MPSNPAPGDLELVRRFVNTLSLPDGPDELGDPDELGAWLAANRLAGAGERFDPADVDRARDVREALRGLLLANAGHGLPAGAVAALNRAAADATLVVRFDRAGQAALEPGGGGVERALGRLLAIAHTAMVDGTWQRLKACANPDCAEAYYDRSKNRTARWCTMESCGNVMKARAYRRRHAPGPA
jgi:predicted RNA-binding Zn ribbon-like protein